MTLPVDPKTRKDGACAECGKPKRRTRRAAKGVKAPTAKDYTRQNKKVWLAHLERDPFCSRECCEKHHKLANGRGPQVCARPGCGTEFTAQPNQTRQRFCSKYCYEREKKAARYDIPGRCSGCGGDRAEYTRGCAQCNDRRRSRARRADPAYVASELVRDRERRKQRRKMLREAA